MIAIVAALVISAIFNIIVCANNNCYKKSRASMNSSNNDNNQIRDNLQIRLISTNKVDRERTEMISESSELPLVSVQESGIARRQAIYTTTGVKAAHQQESPFALRCKKRRLELSVEGQQNCPKPILAVEMKASPKAPHSCGMAAVIKEVSTVFPQDGNDHEYEL